MALSLNDICSLAKIVAKANPTAPVAYSFNGASLSYEALNETLRQELNGLCETPADYRENKNMIFRVIEQAVNDVVPAKVAEAYAQFADVKVFAQGDKPVFKRQLRASSRAKQFVTRVGLAGVYETFRLGKGEESFEVRTSAIGGAASISFEEFLDGRIDMAQVVAVITEGMEELIQKEIGASLKASINQLPPANRVAANGFDEKEMDRLLTLAAAYGKPVIYCTYEFAVNMIPQEAWRYTESMKEELWNTGRLASYKGHQVVILPQGLEDETNSRKTIDPGYAWIIPTGADGKPVKVAFEGGTLVREVDSNHDWSKEIHIYRKVGVVTMLTNNIFAYVDTALMGQMDSWHLDGAASVHNAVQVIQ